MSHSGIPPQGRNQCEYIFILNYKAIFTFLSEIRGINFKSIQMQNSALIEWRSKDSRSESFCLIKSIKLREMWADEGCKNAFNAFLCPCETKKKGIGENQIK